MAINIGNKKSKIYIGNAKVSKVYLGSTKIYSSGSTCTYICDGSTYREEVDDGESCLSPKTFAPEKSGWKFAGWTLDTNAGEDIADKIINELYMEGDELTLYAVFKQDIILTTVSGGVSTSTCKQAYYNNGNISYPKFTISNPIITDATFKGWSTNISSVSIAYATISNISFSKSTTLYAVKQYNSKTLLSYSSETLRAVPKGYHSPTDEESKLISNGTLICGLDTKYSSYMVTGNVRINNLQINNTTTGQITAFFRLNKTTVRAFYRNKGSDLSGSTILEQTGYSGYNGATFTVTVPAVNNGLYANVRVETDYVPDDTCAYFYVNTVVGIGATVTG